MTSFSGNQFDQRGKKFAIGSLAAPVSNDIRRQFFSTIKLAKICEKVRFQMKQMVKVGYALAETSVR